MNKNVLAAIICSLALMGCATKSVNQDSSNHNTAAQNTLNELKNGVSIHFANNSSQIDSEYHPYISAAASGLAQNSNFKLKLDGYTDSSGYVATNRRLSIARANSVANALVTEHGVNSEQLQMKGFGSSQPIASNATVEGRAMNRRVTMTLLTP
ncbi:OmpA family protein [Acinetobacter portensis]|uniref:OmpA family protein n=1 Tax=Acinetobacter portensis TaxID=1839785 RepID=UPI0013CF4C65|nr:OmpA family protein [Acinetobacter portensis]